MGSILIKLRLKGIFTLLELKVNIVGRSVYYIVF